MIDTELQLISTNCLHQELVFCRRPESVENFIDPIIPIAQALFGDCFPLGYFGKELNGTSFDVPSLEFRRVWIVGGSMVRSRDPGNTCVVPRPSIMRARNAELDLFRAPRVSYITTPISKWRRRASLSPALTNANVCRRGEGHFALL